STAFRPSHSALRDQRSARSVSARVPRPGPSLASRGRSRSDSTVALNLIHLFYINTIESLNLHRSTEERGLVASCAGNLAQIIYNRMVVDRPLTEAEFDRVFHALADVTRRNILGRAIRGDES